MHKGCALLQLICTKRLQENVVSDRNWMIAKKKKYIRAMKQILYNMGPLTLVRWIARPFGPGSKLEWVPHLKIEKDKVVLK